jgi:lysozyme family protein
MMKDNFDRCLAEVLRHEGGWADHPKDPGGATMQGVTLVTYSNWLGREATKDELRNMPPAHRDEIYRKHYWDKVKGDELPKGVDLCLFDFAVNSGPKRAVVAVQEALGVNADGVLGPVTMGAIQMATPSALIPWVIEYRLAFLQRLPIWDTFGGGWAKRVKDVQSVAMEMAS